MENTRVYPRSKEYIINTLYDIIELQNGTLILSDAVRGVVYFKVSMYGHEWEYMYTIEEARDNSGSPKERCSATLRIIGERRENAREFRRAFALLESMLDLG